jgi:hypothetical protein
MGTSNFLVNFEPKLNIAESMKNSVLRYFIAFALLNAGFELSAQTQKRPAIIRDLTASQAGSGKVQVISDKQIDDLLAKYIESNSKKSTITGYRLRIFSQSTQMVAKDKAFEAKGKFLKYYPDVDALVTFIPPDWVVYVGKFRSRTDAFRLKKQIESLFPNAFIVEQQINF